MDKPLWMWVFFMGIVLILLAVDLGVVHRKQRVIGIKESLWMSAFYISIGLLFGAWVWYNLGAQSGRDYITGFLIEKSLSVDNIFVISLIFSFFAIPREYQHRVLFWGIFGLIILRGLMIGLGAALIAEFSWILYIFAIFLIATGIKMLLIAGKAPDIQNNFLFKYLKKHFRITPELHEQQFYITQVDEKTKKKHLYLTPLLISLIIIEFVDIVFALDSVPAIFAITTDPFIVYTSNIFAILGLRALYFALAVVIYRFHYLKHALGLILIFIGSKIFIADFLGEGKFPPSLSLIITLALLSGGILFSLYRTRKLE